MDASWEEPLQPDAKEPGVDADGDDGARQSVLEHVPPMVLPTSARPTFHVHPLLFYRHCFRLTSQDDRVPRVLVMSERFVCYLCAADGRATWSFHPITIRMLHLLPNNEQILIRFVHHLTDLLLLFDNKLSAGRENPPAATLGYFLHLLRRENPDLIIRREVDVMCLARSHVIKKKAAKGIEGFVTRLVDGLRGYYGILRDRFEEVKDRLQHESAQRSTDTLRSLDPTQAAVLRRKRSRRASIVARNQPLRTHALGVSRLRQGKSNNDPTSSQSLLALLREQLGAEDDEDEDVNEIDPRDLPPLPQCVEEQCREVVFFRRNVGVTIGRRDTLVGCGLVDEVVRRSRQSYAEADGQNFLHETTRHGALLVDATGSIFFLPNPSDGTDASSSTAWELVLCLPLVLEHVVYVQAASAAGQQRGAQVPAVYNHLTLGSVVALAAVPVGPSLMKLQQQTDSADGTRRVSPTRSTTANRFPEISAEHSELSSVLQLMQQVALVHPSLLVPLSMIPVAARGAATSAGRPQSASLFDRSKLEALSASYTARLDDGDASADGAESHHAKSHSQGILVVFELDAKSASHMAATDEPVTSIEVLSRLFSILSPSGHLQRRRRRQEEQQAALDPHSPPPKSSLMTTKEKVRAEKRRKAALRKEIQKRRDQANMMSGLQAMTTFLDAKESLYSYVDSNGEPWTADAEATQQSAMGRVFSTHASLRQLRESWGFNAKAAPLQRLLTLICEDRHRGNGRPRHHLDSSPPSDEDSLLL